jgi:GDP-D-mannose dehydratase
VKDSDKIALITGITGQDGSYLCELLLEKKIRKTLGWKPAGSFRQLVHEMVEAELAAIDSRR